TENTTFTTWEEVGEVEPGAPTIAIGRAIANTEVYVLGRGMEAVPVGVVGELYIGGDGLARGYLGEAEQTAERFVPHPYSQEAGARLYRSGDLCRWNNDGKVEYIGRGDQQVKVRGYRIEPGEIEAALQGVGGVEQAVVVVKAAEGDKQLVGYVVARAGEALSGRPLREQLRQWLPDYLVPAWIEVVAALPLNANGKVDRQALAQRSRQGEESETYAAPVGRAEETLAKVWEEVLGVERVSREANYFDQGGDSIRGIRVVAQARRRGVEVSIQELFQYPRLRELAEQARLVEISGGAAEAGEQGDEGGDEGAFSLLSATDRQRDWRGVEDAYPLSRIQAGMLFHSALQEASMVYHDLISYRIR